MDKQTLSIDCISPRYSIYIPVVVYVYMHVFTLNALLHGLSSFLYHSHVWCCTYRYAACKRAIQSGFLHRIVQALTFQKLFLLLRQSTARTCNHLDGVASSIRIVVMLNKTASRTESFAYFPVLGSLKSTESISIQYKFAWSVGFNNKVRITDYTFAIRWKENDSKWLSWITRERLKL